MVISKPKIPYVHRIYIYRYGQPYRCPTTKIPTAQILLCYMLLWLYFYKQKSHNKFTYCLITAMLNAAVVVF